MKVHLWLFGMVLGVVLSVHLAMNGKVGSAINNPRVGNALFWCIGAVGALAIGLSGWKPGALDPVRNVHPLLLTAGLFGASLVFAIAWLIPAAGASTVMMTLIVGQVLAGMVMSHFGMLGSPIQAVSLTNLGGAVLMLAGVILATRPS